MHSTGRPFRALRRCKSQATQHGNAVCPDCRPYGFLERFDPEFTPNTTDLSNRRYSYRNQTMIGHWNIAQLANAFIAGGLLDQVACPLRCPLHALL